VVLREYRNSIEFRPLRETDPVEDHQITVCIRKRPLNKKGKSEQELHMCILVDKSIILLQNLAPYKTLASAVLYCVELCQLCCSIDPDLWVL